MTALHVAQAIASFDRSDAISGDRLLARLNKEYLAEVGVADHLASWLDMVVAKRDDADPAEFKRYGSARQLYNFDIDNADAY